MGGNRFDELEQDAFWQAVEEAPVGDSALTWQLMQAISRNREWLLDEFMLDGHSIVSGHSYRAVWLFTRSACCLTLR